jgi:hypothetical protein
MAASAATPAIAFDGANMWVVNTIISPVKGASGIGITKY